MTSEQFDIFMILAANTDTLILVIIVCVISKALS
jgi:hypothetical protein